MCPLSFFPYHLILVGYIIICIYSSKYFISLNIILTCFLYSSALNIIVWIFQLLITQKEEIGIHIIIFPFFHFWYFYSFNVIADRLYILLDSNIFLQLWYICLN